MSQKEISLNIPDSQKDEQWHKDYHDKILRTSPYNSAHVARLNYIYNYYHSIIDAERDHNSIIVSAAGVKYPTEFTDFNELTGFVDLMIGESYKKGFEITVKANSKHALNRKRQAELEMEVDYNLSEFYADEQEKFGAPLLREDMAFTPEELEENKRNYKEEGEIIYQRMIDYWVKKYKWKQKRELLMEDALVGGMSFFQSQIVNGGPRPNVLDVRNMIFDWNTTSPWGEDANYIGWARYMPLTRIRQDHNLTDEQVEKIRELSKGENSMFRLGHEQGNLYDRMRNIEGEEYVAVTYLEWKDVKRKLGLEFESRDGNPQFHLVPRELPSKGAGKIKKEREKAKRSVQKDIEIIRKCMVVAGEVVIEWGELENMVRTEDDWESTGFSICLYLPRWKFGRNISIAEQVIPLQKLKNEAYYMIRKQFPGDMGRFFLNDVSQIPDGYTMQDQMYLADILSVVPINSRAHGVNANYNQFQAVDTSLRRETVLAYMEIARTAIAEIERITGITAARAGQLEAPSQQVGVTEISRTQSQLRSERFYEGFDIFTENVMSLVLGQMKIAFTKDPDKYAHIVGSEGINFLQNDTSFSLDDYGGFVNTALVSDQDRAVLRDMIPLAVQAGGVDFYNGVKMLMESNPREALESLRIFTEKQRAQQRQIEQQQAIAAQAAQQQAAQIEQGKIDGRIQQSRIAAGAMKDVAASKNRNKLISQRGELQDSQLDRNLKREEAEKRPILQKS